MFCPKCNGEYIDGIKECFDCKVPLVEKFHLKSESYPAPTLRYATLSAVAGICYFFILRLTGTLVPDFFKIQVTAQIIQVMSFIAMLTVASFFMLFYRDYVRKEKIKLRNASVSAVIACLAMLLLHVKGLLIIYHADISNNLINSRYFEVIIPWLSSIFILHFFIVFYRETYDEEGVRLKRAILSAVVGSSISTFVRTFILINYLFNREIRWFSSLHQKAAIIFILILAFGFVSILYFFLTFYNEQKCTSSV